MAGQAKDVSRMLKTLVADHGCTVRTLGSGHYRVTLPGRPAVTVAKTPSDRHALANIKGYVRRNLGISL